tara:strand:+ start:3487 stop:3798 length:312 start_codon:yes stop_codon:yes gene_type:complete
MATKEEKRIYQIGKKAYNLLNDLRDLCYADDIDEFDRLHDDLYYQVVGINESLCMFRDEVRDGSDVSCFESEFKEALALAKSIKRFHTQLNNASSKNFNWIYG